jgi:uncharacterized protein YjiS (DUF1127 family)
MLPQQMPVPTLVRLGGRRQAALVRVAALLATRSRRLGETLMLWLERHRQRRALNALSDHMMKDLGLSRCDAGRESGKRFWED